MPDCGLAGVVVAWRAALRKGGAVSLSGANPPELARQVSVGEFSPEACAWLENAFYRYLTKNEPIETALRLDRASRLRQRNEALREAGRLLTLPSDEGHIWPTAVRLADAVKYQARLRRDPQTPVEKTVARAFAAGQKVPCTARQLYELLL